MRKWKLMTGRDCDELRMAWVMTYVNTYDRSTNSSRLQHRIMGMNLRDHSAVSEKPFWEIASFSEWLREDAFRH